MKKYKIEFTEDEIFYLNLIFEYAYRDIKKTIEEYEKRTMSKNLRKEVKDIAQRMINVCKDQKKSFNPLYQRIEKVKNSILYDQLLEEEAKEELKLSEVKKLADVAKETEIPKRTLQQRLDLPGFGLVEGKDFIRSGKRQPTFLTPEGVKKIIRKEGSK